ncbi:hypothetical protein ACTACT_06580 [Pseudomonas syringae]|uniref:hypothetical protein n=1 Tax=Pseudomonas syringae TaxID=317 RepID=UPI003F753988
MDLLWGNIISTSCGGAAAGLVLYGIQQGHQKIKDCLDTGRVERWMHENAGKAAHYPYRSTRVIASHNNLTEDRVRFICSHSKLIFMSRGLNEDLWSMSKDIEDMREVMPNNGINQ